jgi:hypothetical protein
MSESSFSPTKPGDLTWDLDDPASPPPPKPVQDVREEPIPLPDLDLTPELNPLQEECNGLRLENLRLGEQVLKLQHLLDEATANAERANVRAVTMVLLLQKGEVNHVDSTLSAKALVALRKAFLEAPPDRLAEQLKHHSPAFWQALIEAMSRLAP